MGTALYISPEQAQDSHAVDVRADVYSFGATFYHVLTGVPPFEGPSRFAVMLKHVTEPLVPPRKRWPILSERTNEILERCLSKSAGERFGSFASIRRQLDSASPGSSVWDDSDDIELKDRFRHYREKRSQFLLRADPGECASYSFPNGRRLRIIIGDLADQHAQALVSSDITYLPMSGGVAGALRKAAGEDVAREARRLAPVRAGRAVVTSPGNLRARFLFHGITADYQQAPSRNLISDIVLDCLRHADTFTVETLAFPLLGTGEQGFSRKVCLDTMVRTLMRVLLHQPTSVREVTIVIYPTNDPTPLLPEILGRTPPAQPLGYSIAQHCPRHFETIFDYVADPRGRTVFAVGSLSRELIGQGGKPALIADFRLEAERGTDPAGIMGQLNQTVVALGNGQQSVGMIVGVLAPFDHQVTLVNAGLPSPLIRASDGAVRSLPHSIGLPLGAGNDGSRFVSHNVPLSLKSAILHYADGLVQARSWNHETYGSDRLQKVFAGAVGSAREICEAITEDVSRFRGELPLSRYSGYAVIMRD